MKIEALENCVFSVGEIVKIIAMRQTRKGIRVNEEPQIIVGRVVADNKRYFTVEIDGVGYRESFLKVDLLIGCIKTKILPAKAAARTA